MKNLRNTLALVLLLVTVFNVKAQQNDNSLLWKVEGKGIKTSYVFGTFHMIPKESFILKDKVKNALAISELMVLELDMDDPSMQSEMMKHSAMPEGTTLVEYMDKDEYVLIDTYLKGKLGAGLDQFKTFKPLMVSSMVMMGYMGKDLASYEASLIALATAQQKEIKGLETIEYQMGVFDKQPYDIQLDEVVKLLEEKDAMGNMFNEMIEHYTTEDIDGLYNYMDGYFTNEGQMDDMLHTRNANWIPQIGSYSKDQSVFYGVGAGHLGGEKGVINLLREAGYKVSPVLD
ncbi:TraB/GumN family protein [Patiriisocius marinus]|uniref:TraB/GumN family protein n=1 Tax=Patiriisocius marinus TaxID=1397112 RepID=A0A5J4IN60_9FLAO|nr:TraB/GumN family protein [Patiriisocius marinus]GER58769.1 TraB/GumN family protein [Patiriisocius marinus]